MTPRIDELRRHATGNWSYILKSLAGLTDAELSDRHQPCPACGGRDRYRFDDRSGRGDFYCGGCGAGDGFALLQRVRGWDFKMAADEVARLLRLGVAETPPERPQRAPGATRTVSRTMHHASAIWSLTDRSDAAVAAHPYAIRKGIRHAAGAGRCIVHGSWSVIGADADCLVIPSRDLITGELIGVELINAEGAKQSLGHRGVLILGNDLEERIPILIVEGWASAAVAVFGMAFYNGNGCGVVAGGKARMNKVAELVAAKYPARTITILRESDNAN